MIKQRAKELGALPTGLIRPGEVFEWVTLEPWAEAVTEETPVTTKAEPPPPVVQGARVVPGRSEPTRPDSVRRSRGAKTALSDDVI